MKVEKKIHKVWEEWQSIPVEVKKQMHRKKPIIAKWQYVYSSKRGKISLVYMPEYFPGHSFWEIYCLKGKLFDDVERFATKKASEKRIKDLLEGKNVVKIIKA